MIQNRIPVIIDCDPGIDDAMALAVAFAQPTLDIKAVTTVTGNVSLKNTTTNARAILSVLGANCKIYKGADLPLIPSSLIHAPHVHGQNGLGGYTVPKDELQPLEKEKALLAQKRIIEESTVPVTIIAVGPLTNIALLLKSFPEVIPGIAQISLMGGGLYSGNHTAAAEFNILADPEAAEIVFQSGVPILMAGLDVTNKTTIGLDELNRIKAINNPAAQMLATVLSHQFDTFNTSDETSPSISMHDVVSVLAVTNPSFFTGKDLHVVVETAGHYCRGYTLADLRTYPKQATAPNCHVLLDLDKKRFLNEIIKSLKSY